jgi:hypothetical protein
MLIEYESSAAFRKYVNSGKGSDFDRSALSGVWPNVKPYSTGRAICPRGTIQKLESSRVVNPSFSRNLLGASVLDAPLASIVVDGLGINEYR